jgi:hypothetical protein
MAQIEIDSLTTRISIGFLWVKHVKFAKFVKLVKIDKLVFSRPWKVRGFRRALVSTANISSSLPNALLLLSGPTSEHAFPNE